MTHHHLRFHLLHGIQRYAYQNDDGGSAHHQVVHSGESAERNGQQGDDRQEQSADQCNL